MGKVPRLVTMISLYRDTRSRLPIRSRCIARNGSGNACCCVRPAGPRSCEPSSKDAGRARTEIESADVGRSSRTDTKARRIGAARWRGATHSAHPRELSGSGCLWRDTRRVVTLRRRRSGGCAKCERSQAFTASRGPRAVLASISWWERARVVISRSTRMPEGLTDRRATLRTRLSSGWATPRLPCGDLDPSGNQ